LKFLRLLLAVTLLLAFTAQLAPVHAQSCSSISGYYVASLNADIDPGAADFLASAVSSAQAACAGHFVLVLTTNGGDGGSMESMVTSINSYKQWGGTFVTLVAPQGAFAFSAGAYVAEASTKIYMVPGTTIGSATPIVSGIPTGEENTTLTKDIDAFASYMETLTGSNGRNSTATGLMVTRGVSYTCKSASDCLANREDVVDGVINATSLEGALAASPIGVPAGTPIETPGIGPQLVSLLSDPNVSGLLFLVGVIAVLFDIYHPTLVLSVAGIVMIAMALFGLGLFGASVLSIALMIIGAAFIFLEVKTQHGISSLIGVIIFAIGFLLVFQTPTPNFFVIPATTYIFLGVLGGVIVIGSVYLLQLREGLMRRPKHFDMSRMIGKEGRLESSITPGGKGVANIESEEWTVSSSHEIEKGARVRVIGVVGMDVIVEKAV
jgi:membrane-bound serine protease (ClpP class)